MELQARSNRLETRLKLPQSAVHIRWALMISTKQSRKIPRGRALEPGPAKSHFQSFLGYFFPLPPVFPSHSSRLALKHAERPDLPGRCVSRGRQPPTPPLCLLCVFIRDAAGCAPWAAWCWARARSATWLEMSQEEKALSSKHKPYFRGMGKAEIHTITDVFMFPLCPSYQTLALSLVVIRSSAERIGGRTQWKSDFSSWPAFASLMAQNVSGMAGRCFHTLSKDQKCWPVQSSIGGVSLLQPPHSIIHSSPAFCTDCSCSPQYLASQSHMLHENISCFH